MKIILTVEELKTLLLNPKQSLTALQQLNFEEEVEVENIEEPKQKTKPDPKSEPKNKKNSKAKEDLVIDYDYLKDLTATKLKEGNKEAIINFFKGYNCKNLTGLDEMFYEDYYNDIKDL